MRSECLFNSQRIRTLVETEQANYKVKQKQELERIKREQEQQEALALKRKQEAEKCAEEGFERQTRPGTGAAYIIVNCIGACTDRIEVVVHDSIELM